jgi:hypothetical protein
VDSRRRAPSSERPRDEYACVRVCVVGGSQALAALQQHFVTAVVDEVFPILTFTAIAKRATATAAIMGGRESAAAAAHRGGGGGGGGGGGLWDVSIPPMGRLTDETTFHCIASHLSLPPQQLLFVADEPASLLAAQVRRPWRLLWLPFRLRFAYVASVLVRNIETQWPRRRMPDGARRSSSQTATNLAATAAGSGRGCGTWRHAASQSWWRCWFRNKRAPLLQIHF